MLGHNDGYLEIPLDCVMHVLPSNINSVDVMRVKIGCDLLYVFSPKAQDWLFVC